MKQITQKYKIFPLCTFVERFSSNANMGLIQIGANYAISYIVLALLE